MVRKFILIVLAAAGFGFGGAVASSQPASAQSFYFGFDSGPRHYHRPPPRYRHYHRPPPRYYRHRAPRHCERVRVRYFDGYGWRVRTERRCYRRW